MHFSNILLPLAAAGLVAASPIEERAPQSCTIKSIENIVTAVFRPSAVPFCNSYLSVSTKTVTTTLTSQMGHKTATSLKTKTTVSTQTSTIEVTVKNHASPTITAAQQTVTGETVPKNPSNAQSASATITGTYAGNGTSNGTAAASGTVHARDLAGNLFDRRAMATPSRLRTLKPKMLSSVCGCLTGSPTHTVTATVTNTVKPITTQVITTTVTQTSKTSVTQTITASPVPFYLKVAKVSNTTVDGEFAVVDGESMSFKNTTDGATKFTINANGSLISGSNGWVANMQSGSKYSTLFFDSPDTIANISLVEASCNRRTGQLACTDQSANTFFYCETVGAAVVLASADYQGAGCKNLTLNAMNA